MVATRSGVRVCSPSKTNQDQSFNVQATPTGRTTRTTAQKAENPTQHSLAETCSPLEEAEGHHPPTSSVIRSTRASRRHSPEQQSTPVGSIHEADISEVESCCSGVSDVKAPLTGARRRRRCPLVILEDDDISEVESCPSAVSAPGVGRSSRRSLRRKQSPESSDAPHLEAGDTKVDMVPEAASGNSVPNEFKRVTRSQRKAAFTRSSAKQQTDSDLSDTDSHMSGVSGSELSKSISRRVTRSRKQTGPIPIYLDEDSESSISSGPTSRKSWAGRGKKAVIIEVSESQSCDSEGSEYTPSRGMATRTQAMTKALDSDSETMVRSPMGSSCSTQSKGTPCSSHAGSGNSAPGTPSSRCSTKYLTIVLEKTEGLAVKDTPFNSSVLESTVIALDGDCTLLEENECQTLEGRENDGVTSIDPTSNEADTIREGKAVNVIPEEESLLSDVPLDIPACAEAASESAASVRHQQGELCDDGSASEIEVMQETVHSPEPSKPGQSGTSCERIPDQAAENGDDGKVMDAAEVDTHPAQRDEAVEEEDALQNQPGEHQGTHPAQRDEAVEEEDALQNQPGEHQGTHPAQRDEAVEEEDALQNQPGEHQRMQASSDAQQVDTSNEAQVESIQRASSPRHDIADSGPEEQPEEIIVQKTNTISLLESSEDEEEEEEEREEEEEEEEEKVSNDEGDLVYMAEDGGEPSNKSEAAGASMDGLFMIDTRPGQAADEQYYVEEPTEEMKATKEKKVEEEEEEQEDEFVDEEGDDDDDDEDASILFSSRNPLLKEMSSRIDPGMRMKELGGLYINFDGSKSKAVSSSLQTLKRKKIQDEVMKKSVIGPDFEKKEAVPPYGQSKRAVKLKHRVEREKSTGDGWFNMKAPEISQELKGDLQVLKMRGSLDPKRFYKKNDRDGVPKYFQLGTVVDNPVDYYHSRIPKKERKRTMVEELLADAEFRHNNKKKFLQIMAEKAARGAGKRNKKRNNKVHKK